MRRLIIEEPFAATATWSRRVAWFALTVVAIALVLARGDGIDRMSILAVIVVGIVLALVALLLAFVAFAVIWREGRRGLGAALAGFLIAVALLAYPALMLGLGLMLPRINDISTDLADPPAFSISRAALAARGGRAPPDPPPGTRDRQRAAYPGLAPIILDREPGEVFEMVKETATGLGWRVIDSVAPGGRTGGGRLDAVAETRALRFADDITIRLRPFAVGTRIDVRSASRLGQHDFGANARRIQAFAEALKALSDSR